MSLPLVNVLFEAEGPDGALVSGARVRARLTGYELDGTLIVPRTIEGTTDGTGRKVLGLWPNVRGVRGSQYEISITLEGKPLFNGLIVVPEAEPVDQPVAMRLLIQASPPPALDAAQQALLQLQAAQVEIAGLAEAVVQARAVRFDLAQALSPAQQAQARANVGLEPYGYVHNQAAAAAVWTVTHNMGKYPSVHVQDSAGDDCLGSIDYASLNHLTLTFSAAFSGRAICN